MQNYNKDEPYTIQSARHGYNQLTHDKFTELTNNAHFARTQLLSRSNTPSNVINKCQDQLLYTFCEASHIYCAIQSKLDSAQNISDVTKRFMRVELNDLQETIRDMIKMMEEVKAKYPEVAEMYDGAIDFGKKFYLDDQNIDLQQMVLETMNKLDQAMDGVLNRESLVEKGKDITPEQFGEICQKFGESKTMIEDLLLPMAVMQKNAQLAQVLSDAKTKVVDPFIKDHNLGSHLTKKGFAMEQTIGVKSDEKTYFFRPTDVLKVITNKRDGLSYVESRSGVDTQISKTIESENGKGKLTIKGNLSSGITTKYDPQSPEFLQFVQKNVSRAGSIMKSIAPVESIMEGGAVGMLNTAFKSVTITYEQDLEKNSGKPNDVYNILTYQKPDGIADENVHKDMHKQALLELADMVAKELIDNSSLQAFDQDLSVWSGKMENILTLGAAVATFDPKDIEAFSISGTGSALASLLYNGVDFSKLSKAGVEAQTFILKINKEIDSIEKETVKQFVSDFRKEQAFLASYDGQCYLRNQNKAEVHMIEMGKTPPKHENMFVPQGVNLLKHALEARREALERDHWSVEYAIDTTTKNQEKNVNQRLIPWATRDDNAELVDMLTSYHAEAYGSADFINFIVAGDFSVLDFEEQTEEQALVENLTAEMIDVMLLNESQIETSITNGEDEEQTIEITQ